MKIKFGSSRSLARAFGFALGFALLAALPASTTELPSSIRSAAEELLRHVRYLASDELMGRGVDNPGIDLARDYIASKFKRYGLAPGGENGTFLQGLEVVAGATIGRGSRVLFGGGGPLAPDDDWTPFGFSRSAAIDAGVLFAGYGITAKEYGYDDYAGLDARGKIVLVLRYEPPPKNEKSPFQKFPRYSGYATLISKANNARSHGAAGMILVDLSAPEGDKGLIPMRRTLARSDAGIVALQVRREIVEGRLGGIGVSLRGLKERIDREEKPASAALPGLTASLRVTVEKVTKKTDNVIGVLPGADPVLRAESVVVGAHYDHLGLGHYGTRDWSTEGQIHHGADDNASGTAVLMLLAERLSESRQRPARSVVFVAFTAEELGTYGSNYYVNHPTFPLGSTRAMLNLDMVGRMKDNRVTAAGSDTAKEFRDIVAAAGREAGAEIVFSPRSIGGSDHVSFYNKNIPVLHFYTGTHEDYHRPTDTWEKLNIEGMVKVGDLLQAVLNKIADSRRPLTFVHLSPGRPRS